MNPQDLTDLQQLIEFLKEHKVAEFDLERGDLKIRLKFAGNPVPAASPAELSGLFAGMQPVSPASLFAGGPGPGAAPASQPAAAASSAGAPDSGMHIVKSPIVGTFYGSPSPGAAPFVAIGEHVDKGQVIAIVEAMKLMNEIESDAAGEIAKVYVTNGQAIEFGQPLFGIRIG